jgi:hypothetical protein
MKKFIDFYEAWIFLSTHKAFNYTHPKYPKFDNTWGSFLECLDIDVQKVNPKIGQIDDDDSKNTKVEVWLECGDYWFNEDIKEYQPCHDIRLDCGGDTFEKAIINLANLVKKYYKNK